MNIRILREEELIHAAGLSRYVFDTCLRNRMDFTQSIPYIEEYISETNMCNLCRENRLIVWGAFEEEQLVGVGGMQIDGMITMLYVLPQYACRACGSRLLLVMRGYAKDELHLSRTLINATPAWTATYFKRQGYLPINKSCATCVPFVSMQALSDTNGMYKKEKISALTIIFAILGCVGFATIAGIIYMISVVFQ